MLKKFSNRITKISNGRITLSALAILILFISLILPKQAAQSRLYSSGAGSPDLSLFYRPSDLYRIAGIYGDDGRRAYIYSRFSFDLIWPLVYTATLATSISWINRKAFNPESNWRLGNVLPFSGALLDILENISTSLVMFRYPFITPGIDILAPIFSIAKWLSIGLSFMLLAVGCVVLLWKTLREAFRTAR